MVVNPDIACRGEATTTTGGEAVTPIP